MPGISRRTFLAAGAGLVVAAACTRDDNGADGGGGEPALVVASYVHVTGADQRVTLALLQDNGPLDPGGPLDVSFEGPDGTTVDAGRAEFHDQGVELPYLLVRHRFDAPGVHQAKVRFRGRELTAAVQVEDPSNVQMPIPGRPLIDVATPTTADNRGVSPICTRDPVCPLHDVSLDAALGEHRPIAVLFATPALCQSQLCGPVLENLLAQRASFAERVRFLHVEIYTDTTGETLAPAVQAYHLESEPFLFLAGADGVVRERLDNAFDRVEVRAALGQLVS